MTSAGGAAMISDKPTVTGRIRRPARKEDCMARLRHFAVVVRDLDKAAAFYEEVFELKRVGRDDLKIGSAIYLSDGVINLALLNMKGKEGSAASGLAEGSTFVGSHHFGFQVDDLAETQKLIEAHGGKFFFDFGDENHGNFERKFKDPDGIIFDISKHGWQGTDGYVKK
jgi:catechol 2,3-dioxygenase-like lactoylglutathione lyase family enzyme